MLPIGGNIIIQSGIYKNVHIILNLIDLIKLY